MRILIFNWKDIKHPRHGGAEVLTHELAKRFVQHGHNVTMFVTSYLNCRDKEVTDGVEIIRSKPIAISLPYSPTHFIRSFLFYQAHKNMFDIVIDELHGIPFFTPFYVKKKKIFLVCEVAQDIWDRMFSFPINVFGKFIEKWYISFYKNIPVFTISPSTKDDLLRLGIAGKDITILPMGINRVDIPKIKKEKFPTFIFVGRLNRMKGVIDAIDAFALFVKKYPQAKLWIVGRGEDTFITQLVDLIKQKNIEKNIQLFGFVDQKKKFELMSRAHAILVPSIREGFGLIVPEANSVGTPAIVYNVPGLKDTVKDWVNGLITKENSARGLCEAMELIISKKEKYDKMLILAKKESENYNWDNTAKVALQVLEKI